MKIKNLKFLWSLRILTICFLALFFLCSGKQVSARRRPDYTCDSGYSHTNVTGDDDCCINPTGDVGNAIAQKIKDSHSCSNWTGSPQFEPNAGACTYELYCASESGYVPLRLDDFDGYDIKRDDHHSCRSSECEAECAGGGQDCCPGWEGSPLLWREYCYSEGDSISLDTSCGGSFGSPVLRYCNDGAWQEYDPNPPNGDDGNGGTGGPVSGEIPESVTCGEACEDQGENESDCLACCGGASDPAWQKGVWTEMGCIDASEYGIAIFVMRVFFGIVTGLAVVRFIQAGLMLNSDDPEKIKEGKSIAVSALIAIVFAAMLPIILQFMGFNVLGIENLFTLG